MTILTCALAAALAATPVTQVVAKQNRRLGEVLIQARRDVESREFCLLAAYDFRTRCFRQIAQEAARLAAASTPDADPERLAVDAKCLWLDAQSPILAAENVEAQKRGLAEAREAYKAVLRRALPAEPASLTAAPPARR